MPLAKAARMGKAHPAMASPHRSVKTLFITNQCEFMHQARMVKKPLLVGRIDFGRAVSRILSALLGAERIICLSSPYPKPVSRLRHRSGPLHGFLFGLAPDGVFRASALALGAVGSYSTFSP